MIHFLSKHFKVEATTNYMQSIQRIQARLIIKMTQLFLKERENHL